jgi:ribonuclease P protein component
MSALILPDPSLSPAPAPATANEAVALPSAARARLRFGITVSRRQARRAVARNAVKRVLREAARHAALELDAVAPAQGVDVLLRLKAPLPAVDSAGWHSVKQQLRREADGLMAQLHSHLQSRRHAPDRVRSPAAQLAQSAGSAGPAARGPAEGPG